MPNGIVIGLGIPMPLPEARHRSIFLQSLKLGTRRPYQLFLLGFKADRNAFAFRTDDQVANWELVKAGAGIGFGGTYIASFTPSLMRVLPQLKLPTLPMWLASHQELKTNIRIRRVMDFLYERLHALPL